MATVVDYDYIQEISTQEALHNMTSDVTTWYDTEIPWVNTYKINASTSTYNFPEWWGWWEGGIAWWSTNVNWTASDYNTVTWWSGSIYLPDGTALSVSSGNTGNMSSVTYIYYDQNDSSMHYTTSPAQSVGEGKILMCVAWPTSSWKKAAFQAFGTNAQSSLITADNIAANTITGNEIQANSITAYELDVSQLSAISANLWTVTAWDITWTTITAGSTSSWWIKLYPYSSSAGRIEFYYWGSLVWYLQWLSAGVWGAVVMDWDYFYLNTTVLCAGKLRIPVWTNLYD